VRPDFYRDAIGVELDPGAAAWLDRIFGAVRSLWKDFVQIDAWLSWDPQPPTDSSRIAVQIGDQRVGWVETGKTDPYRATMDAAAERSELPFLRATLHRRNQSPRYVVEIPVPRE
jgi:hypothetical protein